jgi:Aspartyl protease
MQLDLTGTLIRMDTGESIQATGLLDSGATRSTIDKSFVEKHKIPKQQIMDHIPLMNADGTLNVHGPITHNVVLLLQIGDHTKRRSFWNRCT